MPKKPSAAKAAAAKFRNTNTYTAYLTGADPSLEIGLIENALGHTTFLIRLNRSTTRQVAITSKVFKGGQKHATRAERGHYLIVKDQEVQGVVNTASAYRELRRAGRLNRDIEDGLPDTSGAAAPPLEEAFEMERGEGEGDEEENIWAKKDEEHEAQTAERLAAILAKRTGAAKKKAILKLHEDDTGFDLFGAATVDAEEDEMPPDEEGSAAGAEPSAKRQADPNSRRSRAAVAPSPEELAEDAAAAAALMARNAAELERELREAEAEEFLRRRPVKDNWEDDEVDIDAI